MADEHGPRPGPLVWPLGRLVGGTLGLVAEPVYRTAIGWRNRRFDAGVGVTRLDRPVISVGNLSVGGTGKTPMVARLVAELVRAGKRPCIAMRGYGKERGESGKSDEAEEYARLVPGVPVVAQADRIAGLRALFATEQGRSVDVVVLDDGFQHRKIARDVDIVLIDASAGTLRDRLLPAGWLREPMASLKRADAVVVTHAERAGAEGVARIIAAARAVKAGLVTAVCRHAWAGMRMGDEVVPVETLRGKRVLVVAAIGNPRAFRDAVTEAGIRVGRAVLLRDHDPYLPETVEQVVGAAGGLSGIVTTEKDWTKLRDAKVEWPCPVYRPLLEMTFDRGWEDVWAKVAGAVGIGGGAVTSPTLPGTGEVGGVVASA